MFYWLAHFLVRQVLRFIYRWHLEGLDNIPAQGGAILCSNHVSAWDPPLVACMIKQRQVHFMAKAELFRTLPGRILFNALGTFPVRRDTADRKAIRKGLEVLQQGGLLGIFPEGTRSRTGQLLDPLAGVGMFALKSGAPVVPIAIKGPYKPFRPVKVKIGKPIFFSPEGEKIRGKEMSRASRQVMEQISCLLQQE